MRQNTIRFIALTAAATLALTACGSSSGGGDKIRIGTKFDQPGIGLKTGSTMSGLDVEVGKAVAKKLGYKEDQIDWVETPSPQRETMLKAGNVDLIVASYSITDKRKKEIQFAGPYIVAGQDLLVRSDETSITGPDTLNGKKLCSVAGSTPAEKIAKSYPGVQLQQYDTYSLCVEALMNKKVDALTTDDTILAGYASQEAYKGKLKLISKPFTQELYGIGLAKGSDKCEKINTALNELYSDGTMAKIVKETLGQAGYTPNPDSNPPKIGGHCG